MEDDRTNSTPPAPQEDPAGAGPDATVLMPAVRLDPSEPAPLTGKQRLKASFLKPSRSQGIVGVLLALVGFAAVVQVRSTELDNSYEGRRQEDLIQIFNGLTGTSDQTRREIARLEQTRRDLQVDTSAREAAVEQAEQRLVTLNVLAGLVKVSGPGVRVTITEGSAPVSVTSLLDMVQELRTAGAEAMEFNDGVRLVASSHFEVVDGAIVVDGTTLRPPYVLEAIGEPHTLRTGLEFPSGPIQHLEEDDGADVDLEELDRVDITSTVDPPRPQFATPAEGQ